MIAFLILPFVATLVLYLNIRKVARGNKGVLIAGLPIILTFGSFFLARCNSAFFSCVQCFMVIWLCQALWMYLFWDMVCGVRWLARKIISKTGCKTARGGRDDSKCDCCEKNFVRNGARIVLAATVLLTAGLLAYGIPNHYDYKIRTLDVEFNMAPYSAPAENFTAGDSTAVKLVTEDSTAGSPVTVTRIESHREFKAVFFSDLHIDPLFKQEKLERLIAQCDSIQPDFILFGGDLADVHDSVLTAQGYDKLLQRLAATAKVSAVAINGNHEAYMERSGSDPEGFLRRAGWIFLDDSTACIPADAPVACFTGRRDFQKARVFDEPRKNLQELMPVSPKARVPVARGAGDSRKHSYNRAPWILMDHQPKGVDETLGDYRPDFALSGHTHDGQFFPGNILINWIWPLAYGEGFLNDIHWLVSSGVDSWGPPVRAGSDTEIWILDFKVNVAKPMLYQKTYSKDSTPSAEFLAEVDSLNKEAMQKIREENRKRLQALIGNARFSNTPEEKSEKAADSSTNNGTAAEIHPLEPKAPKEYKRPRVPKELSGYMRVER